jgi:O-antigen/teichoic acid export membrane protein
MGRSLSSLRKLIERIRSSSVARNAGWVLFGQGLSYCCQGAYFIMLARLLGSVEYGIYAAAFATVAIVSVYSPLGSPFTLIRHVSSCPQKFAFYWGNVLVTIAGLGSVLIGILVWLVPRLAHSCSWQLVLCVAVGDCFFGQVVDACSRVFQAFEKMRFTAFFSLLTNLLRTLLAAMLLWRLHHATASEWAAATLAISFIGCCLSLTLVTTRCGMPAFSPKLLRNRLREGCVFAMSSSTMGIYNNVDKAMLGHYGMNAANGIYTMAYRVVDICTTPITSIHAAAFPTFFRKGLGGVSSTTEFALRILKRTGPVAIAFTAAMALAAPIIPRLVGPGFSQSVPALRLLCILPVCRSFQLSAGDALTGAGFLNLRLGIQVTAAIFNFGINLYLIPHYGWVGAGWSSLATDGLLGAVNWFTLLGVRRTARELRPVGA